MVLTTFKLPKDTYSDDIYYNFYRECSNRQQNQVMERSLRNCESTINTGRIFMKKIVRTVKKEIGRQLNEEVREFRRRNSHRRNSRRVPELKSDNFNVEENDEIINNDNITTKISQRK